MLARNMSSYKVSNGLPLSCSEDLFPVGWKVVVCSLCRFVRGDFNSSPPGTKFVPIGFTSSPSG